MMGALRDLADVPAGADLHFFPEGVAAIGDSFAHTSVPDFPFLQFGSLRFLAFRHAAAAAVKQYVMCHVSLSLSD